MKNFKLIHKLTACAVVLTLFAGFSLLNPLHAGNDAPSPEGVSQYAPPIGCSASDALSAVKADADVQKCVSNAPPAPYRLKANIAPLGPCLQGGSSWEVYIYAEVPCVNPPFCPLAPIILVARVVVDCNCNVTLVDCYV